MGIRRFLLALFAFLAFCQAAPAAGADSVAQDLSTAAQANVDAGHPHLAIYDLEKAIQASPDDPDLLRACARLLDQTGHPALAAEHWRRLADLLPFDTEARVALTDAGGPPSLPESLTRAPLTLDPGLGLWMNGGGRDQVKQVNAYNTRAPQGQHVRYLFVHVGRWVLDGEQSRWDLDLDQALIAADTLAGDASVQVWIDGEAQGAENVDPITWERLAAELADRVQVQRHFGGVHLAARCCNKALYPLYAALRRRLTVPLSLEVGGDEPEAFQYADFVVLKPVTAKGDAPAYAGRVSDLAAGFLNTAQAVGGKAMVGLSGLGADDAGKWYEDGRHALSGALPREGDTFMGVAVWGLVADDEGTVSVLAPDVWKQMELPVVRP